MGNPDPALLTDCVTVPSSPFSQYTPSETAPLYSSFTLVRKYINLPINTVILIVSGDTASPVQVIASGDGRCGMNYLHVNWENHRLAGE